jgi:hypothetical protein
MTALCPSSAFRPQTLLPLYIQQQEFEQQQEPSNRDSETFIAELQRRHDLHDTHSTW